MSTACRIECVAAAAADIEIPYLFLTLYLKPHYFDAQFFKHFLYLQDYAMVVRRRNIYTPASKAKPV